MLEKKFYRGVPINNLTEPQAFEACKALLDSGVRTNHIVTLTIGMYLEARHFQDFSALLEAASLVIPESFGLKLYSWLYPPSFGRILSGRYLANDLIKYCAESDKRVVLFGSTPDNRNLARDRISGKKGTDIAVVPGEYDFSNATDSAYVAQRLDTLSADFAVMAGTEVQAERWINQWLVRPGVNIGMVGNFGQGLDCEAEQKWYPPRIATHMGVGWLVRIPTMPAERRKRYFHVLSGLASLAVSDLLGQSKQGAPTSSLRD